MLPTLDPKTWQLQTDRLIIRAAQPGEGAIVNAATRESFAEISPWLPWATRIPTIEESESVSCRSHDDFANGRDFAVRLWLPDGTFVGGSGLHRGNRAVPSFEIGYWCRTSLAGHGYISEAAAALCDFGFGELGVKRLEIRCDSRNEASRRVAEKRGFQLEGVLRHFDRANDGTLADICMFALLSPTK